jgi:hypothetical protein
MTAFWGGSAAFGSWLNASQRRQRAYERLSAFHDEVEEEAARGSSVRDVEFRRAAKVPVVTFVDVHTNLALDVSVEAPDGPHSSAAVRAALTTAPEVAPLVIALKIALAQASLNKPFHGGVGPFATCAMVCDALRALGGPTLSCCEVVSSGAGAVGSSSSSSGGGGGASSSSGGCGSSTGGGSSSNNNAAPVDLGALLQSVLAVYASHDEHHLHLYDAVTGKELGGAAWAWPRVIEKVRSWQERLSAEGCLSAMLHGWPRQQALLPDRAALEGICAYRQPSSAPRVHRGSLARGSSGDGSSRSSRESRSRSRARARRTRSSSRSSSSRSPCHRKRRARSSRSSSSRSRSRSASRDADDDDREARGGRRRRRRSHASSSSSERRRRRRRSTSRRRRFSRSRERRRSRSRSEDIIDRGCAKGGRRRFYEEEEEGGEPV